MVVSGIFLPLPFPLRFRSLGRGGLSFGLGTLGTDVDGWGRLYHDGAASATDGPLLCLPAASYLFEEAADGGPERLHHPFIRAMAFFPAAVFILTRVGSPVRLVAAKSSSWLSDMPVLVALPARFLASSAPMNICCTFDLAGMGHLPESVPSIAKT